MFFWGLRVLDGRVLVGELLTDAVHSGRTPLEATRRHQVNNNKGDHDSPMTSLEFLHIKRSTESLSLSSQGFFLG